MQCLLDKRLTRHTVAVAAFLSLAVSSRAATPTDLSVRVTGASLRVGSLGRYSVTVSNRGPQATDDEVHLSVTLPDGLSFAFQTNPAWSCTTTGQAVDCLKLEPLAARRTSTVRLRVGVCTTPLTFVTTAFQVVYAADTNSANDVATRNSFVHSGQCVVGTLTPTATPGTPTPRTATATPPPGNPNAPVITGITCNGASQCTVSLGQSFTVQFSFTDANANATSWRITATRDDGAVSPAGSGSLGAPSASGTVPLQYDAFSCDQPPCRQSTFVFSAVVTDTTNLASAPAAVTITVRASGQ